MAKPRMYQFMGDSKKAQPVKVSYDPEIAKRYKEKQSNKVVTEEVEHENFGKIGNDLTNMGVASAMNKDENINRLIVAYDNMQVFTITAAANLLNVSYATAKKYAKEAGIMIMDDQLKNPKYLDGRKPKNFK